MLHILPYVLELVLLHFIMSSCILFIIFGRLVIYISCDLEINRFFLETPHFLRSGITADVYTKVRTKIL